MVKEADSKGMVFLFIDDIDLRLFEDCRHELCNELNKEEIYEEIYGWIMDHMNK